MLTDRQPITADTPPSAFGHEVRLKYCEECGAEYYSKAGVSKYCIPCAEVKKREQVDDAYLRRRGVVLANEYWMYRTLTLEYDPSPEGEAFRVGSLHARADVLREIPLGVWRDGTRFTSRGRVEVIMRGRLVRLD